MSIRAAFSQQWLHFIRWSLSLAIVLGAHGLALYLLAARSEPVDADAGVPVVFVELAPIPVAPPAPPTDLAVGPPETESQASADQDTPPQATEKQEEEQTPPPDPVPLPQTDQNSDAALNEPATPQPEQEQVDQSSKTPPVTAMPQPPPSAATIAAAPPSTQEQAAEPKGPALGHVAVPTAASVRRWEQSLVAQIERFKRYPQEARDVFGIARVAFTIDRRGRLLSARIIGSSGSPILDDEAVATLRRAAPFPMPPQGIDDPQLSFILPLRFARSTR